ncbi:MAG: FtsX-like permease family protein [Acidobacteriota bacterium]
MVGPGYFQTMGIPLLRGRGVQPIDSADALLVTVINQAMAERFWEGEDPLGQRIQVEGEEKPRRIVGIVGNLKRERLDSESSAEMYFPISQAPDYSIGSPHFAIKTRTDPMSLVAAVRQRIWALDADLPLVGVRTLERVRHDSLAHPRFRSLLLGSFASMALALSALGLFGVVSHLANQRTREFGLRMALGARGRDVLSLVLRQGLGLVLAGLAAGLLCALWLTDFLEGFLYGVEPVDAPTFAGAAALLALVALAACLLPARRAARIDPATSLRYE